MAYKRTLREEWTHDGYSKEEKYFYELNRELIDQLKHSPTDSSGYVIRGETSDFSNRPGTQKKNFFGKLRRKLFPKEFSPDLF